MNEPKTTVKCPECGCEFDVADALRRDTEAELRRQFAAERKREQKALEETQQALEEERENFEKAKREQARQTAALLQAKLAERESALKAEISAELREQQSVAQKALRAELQEKSDQIKALRATEIEVERLKREKDELQSTLQAAAEKRLSAELAKERERIHKDEEGRAMLKILEKEKVISQLSEQLKSAQRKADQNSSQLQGEVQELAIEDWLRRHFPHDEVVEVKKGARGADCLHQVVDEMGRDCGAIYFESKRAARFQPVWIEKFKDDIRNQNAEIGVLITAVMPADMPRMGFRDGVWICTFEEFPALTAALRQMLLRVGAASVAGENRAEKTAMLYDFLTGNEFRHQLEGIAEGFISMKSDLDKEKRAMQRIWKQREKHIEKALLCAANLYGSVKGIAGGAIAPVPQFALPGNDDDIALTDD